MLETLVDSIKCFTTSQSWGKEELAGGEEKEIWTRRFGKEEELMGEKELMSLYRKKKEVSE